MTDQEIQGYNSLSSEQREDYNYIKRKHPNWSHQQILTKMAFNPDPFIEGNKNPNDPEVMTEILKAGKQFLIDVGCFVWDVFELIDDAISSLADMIADGINYVGQKISDFWEWLTN